MTFHIFFFLVITLSIQSIVSVPVSHPLPPRPFKLDANQLQTDNYVPPPCTANGSSMTMKNGLINPRYRWQNFNVHPDRAFTSQEVQSIEQAMYTLSVALPCIPFGIWPQNSNPTGDYVRIVKGSNIGCWSIIGRAGGAQELRLQTPLCMDQGTIMHEMIHALGFHHEQCRYDRDDYVNIHWGNIQNGQSYNFEKLPTDTWDTFGSPYNTRSIMHYHNYEFSGNGQQTISSKNGQPVGSLGRLLDTDINRLRRMYQC